LDCEAEPSDRFPSSENAMQQQQTGALLEQIFSVSLGSPIAAFQPPLNQWRRRCPACFSDGLRS